MSAAETATMTKEEETAGEEEWAEEGRVEEALSGAMANYMFIANFETEEKARDFIVDVLRSK